jgi:hypothetical protein
MTLREYLEGRGESLREFCVKRQIPIDRARNYYYQTNTKITTRLLRIDMNKIMAETKGLVDINGIAPPCDPEIFASRKRGRPERRKPNEKLKKKINDLVA